MFISERLEAAEPVLLAARQKLLAAEMPRGPAMESTLAALHFICTKTNRPDQAATYAAEHRAISEPQTTQPTTEPSAAPTTQG